MLDKLMIVALGTLPDDNLEIEDQYFLAKHETVVGLTGEQIKLIGHGLAGTHLGGTAIGIWYRWPGSEEWLVAEQEDDEIAEFLANLQEEDTTFEDYGFDENDEKLLRAVLVLKEEEFPKRKSALYVPLDYPLPPKDQQRYTEVSRSGPFAKRSVGWLDTITESLALKKDFSEVSFLAGRVTDGKRFYMHPDKLMEWVLMRKPDMSEEAYQFFLTVLIPAVTQHRK